MSKDLQSPTRPSNRAPALAITSFAVAICLLGSACASAPAPHPERPWLPVPERAGEAAPRVPPASSTPPARAGLTDTRQPADPLTALDERLRAAVAAAAGASGHSLGRDRAVDEACRGAARELLATQDRGAAVSHLRRWMLDEQVSDAIYLPLTVELALDATPPAELVTFVSSELRARGITHIGVGSAPMDGGRALSVVVLLRRLTELGAFPREVTSGSAHLLWAKSLSGSTEKPRALLSSPTGAITELTPAGTARGDGAVPFEVRFEGGPGRYLVQVMTEDQHGTQVANLVEVWCDQPPMRVVRVPPPPLEDTAESAQEAYLLSELNAFRQRQGLTPLAADERLQRAARAHSADMGESRYFGHISPSRGTLADRLRSVGLAGSYARENIAMSVSAVWAHESLVESPSHRSALLDERVTHVGVGVVRRHSGLLEIVYVTEIAADLGE